MRHDGREQRDAYKALLFKSEGLTVATFFEDLFMLLMYVFYVHICMCVPDTHRKQKRASDSLGLELQMVISHRMGAGN